jgi:HD-like signal output (HDOD) protein
MYKYFSDEYSQVVALVKEKDILIRDAEKKVMGFEHTNVGYFVGINWNLPSTLLKIIRYHHNPTRAIESKRIVAIVHVADILCRAISLGNAGDTKIPAANKECWEFLNLDKQAVKNLFSEMEQESIKAYALLAFTE